MTRDIPLSTSRRQLLAGIGAAGLASAGAGLGTTAYFSDTESFGTNTLQAGELDLKLDYKATYSGGPGRLEAVRAMGYPDATEVDAGTYLLGQAPTTAEWQQWEDVVQDEGLGFDFCSDTADEFLVNGDAIPMFTLSDVKPGDSGEVTVSIHICDNPAYLRMFGEIVDEAENGQSEPEVDAEGEDTDGRSELADLIEVCVWYDEDCDNVYEPTGTGQTGELEVALVSDTSGSMAQEVDDLKVAAKSFVDNLASPDEAAAVSFASSASLDQGLTTDYQAVKDAIDLYNDGGTTNMTAGIDVAANELLSGANATAGASKVMVLLSDGSPNNASTAASEATAAKNAGIRLITIALGGGADTTFLENIATSPDDAFVAPDAADLDTIYAEIAQIVLAGERKAFEGTLREVMTALGERPVLDGNRQEEGIQCYPGNTTQCIGFEWTLPADSGNASQTDSVTFDFGFDAEQCRHNEVPEEVDA
jgi:predicted ribosomally synthesized peptide with SipW-like signal peptide